MPNKCGKKVHWSPVPFEVGKPLRVTQMVSLTIYLGFLSSTATEAMLRELGATVGCYDVAFKRRRSDQKPYGFFNFPTPEEAFAALPRLIEWKLFKLNRTQPDERLMNWHTAINGFSLRHLEPPDRSHSVLMSSTDGVKLLDLCYNELGREKWIGLEVTFNRRFRSYTAEVFFDSTQTATSGRQVLMEAVEGKFSHSRVYGTAVVNFPTGTDDDATQVSPIFVSI